MKYSLMKTSAITALCFGLMNSAAVAQSDDLALEEIFVTAQRRVQTLFEVPVSITAFTADMIQRANMTEAKDYIAMAPNITFTEDGEVGNRGFNVSIRGVSDVDLGEVSAANSIGYYLDEFNIGIVSRGVINPQLLDVERIEVLRGPQGTYFGRNAVGGALNLTTKKPDENFYAEVGAGYERFDTINAFGILNVPVSDKVFARFVASYEESDGLVENINPMGAPNSGFEFVNLRGAVRFVPTDRLTMDLSVWYSDENGLADATVPSGVLDLDTKSIFGDDFVPVDTTGFFPENQRFFDHDADEINENSSVIVNARIVYEFDNFSFHSVTGYLDTKNNRVFDQDNIFSDTIVRTNDNSSWSFSQELRLQSTGTNTVDWTVGALFARDRVNTFSSIQAGSERSIIHPNLGTQVFLLPPIPQGFRINENSREQTYGSYAVFGDVNWHVTEDLTLIAGGRYTHDTFDLGVTGFIGFENLQPDVFGSTSFDDFSPRVGFNYDVTDSAMVFGVISKGYKAGGLDRLFFNGGTRAEAFDSEKMWNYELGVKARFLDDRVSVSASAFYLDWSGLQVQSNFLAIPGDIGSAETLTLNAEGANNFGFEMDVVAAITSELTLSAGFGFIDSEFDNFPDAVLSGGAIVDVTGQALPRTPRTSWNIALDYVKDITETMDGFVRIEANGQSSVRADIEAVAAPILGLPDFPYRVPAFQVVNLRTGIEADTFTVNAYIENVLGEDYYTSTTENFGLSGIRVRPHPRIYGVRFTYKFN